MPGDRVAHESYQRLEFLGDRVLALVIAEMLYMAHPKAEEGDLARRLNSLVRRETCAEVALALDPTGLAVQDDGRVLVAGMTLGALRVERYMLDGRLDPTFAAAGRFELPWPPYGFYVGGLAIDTDGSIVISGGSEEMALVRLTPDGVLDTTFSGDGIATPLRWSSNSVLPLGWELTPVPGGYLVGSASGRKQFDRIKSAANDLWERPEVQKTVKKVDDFVGEKAPVVHDLGAAAVDSVSGTPSSTSPSAAPAPTQGSSTEQTGSNS